jgi:hypothetical protein
MNTIDHLPLQESMAQRGAGKHDRWQGYMTILVVNHGIIKSISILTTVIRPMIKFDVDTPRDCFCLEVKWTLAIHYQLSTLSALDVDRVHHLPHALLWEKILIVCQKGINEFQMLCGGFKAVEIIKLCYVVPG